MATLSNLIMFDMIKRMKKIAYILLIFVFLLLVVTAGALFGIQQYMSSEKGFQTLLSYIDQPLREQGIMLKVQSGELSFFSGLHLANVEANMERSGIVTALNVPSIHIAWDIQFFPRKLTISKFHITQPRVKVQVQIQELKRNQPEGSEAQEMPMDWRELFDSLPISIAVEDLAIDNLHLEGQIVQPDSVINLKVTSLQTLLQLLVSREGLELTYVLKMEPTVELLKPNLQLKILANQNLHIKIKPHNQSLHFDLSQFDLQLDSTIEDDHPLMPKTVQLKGQLRKSDKLVLTTYVEGLKIPGLPPSPLRAQLSFPVNQSLDAFVAQLKTEIYQQKVFATSIDFNLSTLAIKLAGEFQVPQHLLPKNLKISPLRFGIENLNNLYHWQARLSLDEVLYSKLKIDKAMLNAQATISQESSAALQLALDSSIQNILWDERQWPLKTQIQVKTHSRGSSQFIDFEGHVQTEFNEFAKPLPLSFNIELKAEKKGEDLLNLESLKLNLNEEILNVKIRGKSKLKSMTSQLFGQVNLHWPNHYPAIMGTNLSGNLQIPWEVSISKGQKLSLQTALNFEDFGIQNKYINVEGIRGSLPVSEDLILNKDKLKFAYFLQQNAFERVAFNKIRPFLTSTQPLILTQISYENKDYGPFVGYVQLNQNLLSMNKFDFKLSQAAISGESFINLQPSQLSFGLLTRFSQMSVKDILPAKFLKRVKEDKPMNGRTHFEYNVSKSYINGRIDVLDMSSHQLMALVNILDSNFEDDNLNNVRNYLSYAYPTYVGLNFNHSFMDLDITTNLLRIPTLHSLPLGVVLKDISLQINEKMKEVPFQ